MKMPLSARRLAGYIRKRLQKAGRTRWIQITLVEAARVCRMSQRTMSRAFNFIRAAGLFLFRSGNSDDGRGRFLIVAQLGTTIVPQNSEKRGIVETFSPKLVAPTDNNINLRPDVTASGDHRAVEKKRKRAGYAYARDWAKGSYNFFRMPESARESLIDEMASWWAEGAWRGDISTAGERVAWIVANACDELAVSCPGAYCRRVAAQQKPVIDIKKMMAKARESVAEAIRSIRETFGGGATFGGVTSDPIGKTES